MYTQAEYDAAKEGMVTQAQYDAAKEGMYTQAQYDAAKEGMFTQAEVNVKVEEAVEAAAKGMYTQEQLNESVRDATAGMDTEEESIEGAPSEHDRIFVYDGLCEEYNDKLYDSVSGTSMGTGYELERLCFRRLKCTC